MEISAVTSLSGTPSLSQVTLALGKELISALNSRTSSSSADSYSPNSGQMDINSLAVREERDEVMKYCSKPVLLKLGGGHRAIAGWGVWMSVKLS